jgi:hypothetical protein
MSQQYRTPPPPPVQGGWGPGPQFRPPAKSSKTPWIVMGCAVFAVLLIAIGVVLMVSGKDDDSTPVAGATPAPVGTLFTPEPTSAPKTKGPNDVGVEVGKGVWFTPAKGWLQGPDKTVSGQYWILQENRQGGKRRGFIDGYFWVRQTQLYDAKGFAEHLVDIESNGYKNVRIGKGTALECAAPVLKSCYTITYTADVPALSGKLLPFRGFVTAYEDQYGQVTATDVGLETSVYDRRAKDLAAMNESVVKSYS